MRRGTRKKRKEKRTEKRNKEKKFEGDYQTKGMSVFVLVKTCLSLVSYYSFTVYRLIGGWRMEKTTTENENLKSNRRLEKS